MENEISNMNTSKKNKEVKVVNLVKKDSLLFIELSNKRKFLTDRTLIQEFTEFNRFYDVFKMNETIYVVMGKDWKKHLVEFATKEIIISFDRYDDCSKKSENTFKIGKKLFNLGTRDFIPNTENLEPNMFSCLGKDLYLFDTTEESYLERRILILNSKGEQLLDCGKTYPYLVNDNLILIDSKQEEIRIEKYKDEKFDTENEIVIKKSQTEPHYYKKNICVVKNNIVYVINPNQEIVKQFPLPIIGVITSSTIENDTLLMTIKPTENQKVKVVGINLINGKHFEAERIGIRPLAGNGPALNITIAMDNIIYDKNGREIYHVRLLDENFNVLEEVDNVVYYDYLTCNNEDKIWLQTKRGGVLYNASIQKSFKNSYTDIHYQFNDENTKIDYGFGFDENTKKLQILDEIGNVLIDEIPYEQLGFAPRYGEFGFRYLNGYACFKQTDTIDIGIEITRNSIIDNKGNIIYNKANTHIYPIGNCFQIKEGDKTVYFNTLNGEFNEKVLISSNNTPLLEEQNQFEITEDGALVLKQTLNK